MKNIWNDNRVVLTLDAGGTNFVFNAIKGGKIVFEPYETPSYGNNLDKCLKNIIEGFQIVKSRLNEDPVAICFAFPGPADYPNGIIGDLGNLSGFRGGVALGPMLNNFFKIPVYIQNDGDLYAYGEAIGGLLYEVNKNSNKKYKNLIGITLGTGFGAGLVHNDTLITGDNSMASEVWLTSNSISPDNNAEEGVSTRAIIKTYNVLTKGEDDLLMPKDIFDIAMGYKNGDKEAAIYAFKTFARHLGDAIANLINLFDGLVVIGGGITGAASLFMPEVMKVLKGKFNCGMPRLIHNIYNLDEAQEQEAFFNSKSKKITIPFSEKTIEYFPDKKIGIAMSKINASTAISIGAYAFALNMLDNQ